MIRSTQLLLLALAAGVSPSLASAAALATAEFVQPAQEGNAGSWTPRAPSVLVFVDRSVSGEVGFDQARSKDAVDLIRRSLDRLDYKLIDPGQVDMIRKRDAELFDAYVAENSTQFERFVASETHADVWVRVAVKKDRERMQQGRFVVTDEVSVIVADAYGTSSLLNDVVKGQGRSMEDYREAHDQALADALGSPSDAESALGRIQGAFARRAQDELENGREFRVTLLTNHKELSRMLIGSASELRELPGVVSAEKASGTPQNPTYVVRYRGSIGDLEETVGGHLLGRRQEIEGDIDRHVEIESAMSQRSLNFVLDLGDTPEPNLDGELRRALSEIAARIYEKSPEWMTNASVRFLPASIPTESSARRDVNTFSKGYWSEYDRVAKLTIDTEVDPMDYEGTVQIGGVNYDGLRQAKQRQEAMFASYADSEAGKLATTLAEVASDAFREASEGAIEIVVSDVEQSEVLSVIKAEAELFREEGAVDPDSIAFFERAGTQRGVFTRINRVLDSYRVTVTVVDMNGGPKHTESKYLDDSATKPLDVVFGI